MAVAGDVVAPAFVVLVPVADDVAVALALLDVPPGVNVEALLLLGFPPVEVAVALLLLPAPLLLANELELLLLLLVTGLARVGGATAINKLPTRQIYKAQDADLIIAITL